MSDTPIVKYVGGWGIFSELWKSEKDYEDVRFSEPIAPEGSVIHFIEHHCPDAAPEDMHELHLSGRSMFVRVEKGDPIHRPKSDVPIRSSTRLRVLKRVDPVAHKVHHIQERLFPNSDMVSNFTPEELAILLEGMRVLLGDSGVRGVLENELDVAPEVLTDLREKLNGFMEYPG